MLLQIGPGVVSEARQEAEEVRQQVAELHEEAGGLAQQISPALDALVAASQPAPYQPPPHEDKVAVLLRQP